MEDTQTTALPRDLEAACRRFEDWRRTRARVAPIPDVLWTLAVRLAATHGVHRTARALGLDSGKLKRLTQAGATTRAGKDPRRRASPHKTPPRGGRSGEATFVELAPALALGASDCVLELEGRSGSRLRIRLSGAALGDLASFARQIWAGER